MISRVLPLAGLFSDKLQRSIDGRKVVFELLKHKISATDRVIWFHCASLGEYEQGVPVMEALRQKYPEHKLIITFFSPSGYEIKKDSPLADVVTYMPLDTKSNARKFVELVHPELVVFVKYEFWPNFLIQLGEMKIPTLYVSATFRRDQIFFRWYGKFMQPVLQNVQHFFVQDVFSKEVLSDLGYTNATLSGDTRFDRVSSQLEMDNTLVDIVDFVQDRLCVVCGSTWPEDDAVLLEYIHAAAPTVCFVMAPHEIKPTSLATLQNKLKMRSVLLSEKDGKVLSDYQVLIVDAIGYLTRIYSYADIAYVGGGMGTAGLHNILEAATFGIPIVIGKNFDRFLEAKQLQKLAGLFSVSTAAELKEIMTRLETDKNFREQAGIIAGDFIKSHTGATAKVVAYIAQLLQSPK